MVIVSSSSRQNNPLVKISFVHSYRLMTSSKNPRVSKGICNLTHSQDWKNTFTNPCTTSRRGSFVCGGLCTGVTDLKPALSPVCFFFQRADSRSILRARPSRIIKTRRRWRRWIIIESVREKSPPCTSESDFACAIPRPDTDRSLVPTSITGVYDNCYKHPVQFRA